MKTNKNLVNLIKEIKEHAGRGNSGFWKRVVKELENSTRRKRKVNVSKINKVTKANEVVLVPGDVLGTGDLDHEVSVAALRFSESASEKIKNKLTIKELFEKNPKGKDVRILG
ncbi:50S ribosomal protein L18e [archaeon]|nr:50S ribosomal protein L18e [archaeon]